MKLGFYSHLPAAIYKGEVFLPAYMGLFVEGLSLLVKEMHLVAHLETFDAKKHDYKLLSKNIKLVNLNWKTSAPNRFFGGFRVVYPVLKELRELDHLIVRAPSPLAWWFRLFLDKRKVHFLLVGDEKEGAEHLISDTWRKRILKQYLFLSDYILKKALKGTNSFVNSPALKLRYDKLRLNTTLVSTTILDEADLFFRENACTGPVFQLLYTGRIDPGKGLPDVLDAMKVLQEKGLTTVFNIVGWEEGSEITTTQIKEKAKQLNMEGNVLFHGKKKVGTELNEFYRNCDIYLMPSYHEGFPRTLWESMANGLPVVATRVGAIPHLLADEEHALLIDPKSPNQIAQAIERIAIDPNLRKKLLANAFDLAKTYTMQIQHQRIIERLT